MNTSITMGEFHPVFDQNSLLKALSSGVALFVRPDITPLLPPKPVQPTARSASWLSFVATKLGVCP